MCNLQLIDITNIINTENKSKIQSFNIFQERTVIISVYSLSNIFYEFLFIRVIFHLRYTFLVLI